MAGNESTEQNVQNSIEETGGIPVIQMGVSVSGMTQYPVDKTLSVPDMAADAKEVGDAIADLQSAISDIASETYPVGTIIMTIGSSAPTFTGTWVEVAVTATRAQMKTGKHDYSVLQSGDTGGSIHFWLRTA